MKVILTFGALALTAVGSANAQQLMYGPTVSYPPAGDAASTPASAAARGAADLIRAQGLYNETTANALIKFEQAREKYLDNQKEFMDISLMRQRMLATHHDQAKEETRQRNTRLREEKVLQAKIPPRLNSGQLDPYTGDVAWPRGLQRDTFAIDRADIEKLLAARAEDGPTVGLTDALHFKTQELRADLRGNIRLMRTQEYLQARKFLDSLALESEFPVQDVVVAKQQRHVDARTAAKD